MDLQTRKLNMINFLINIQDEKIFEQIESVILNTSKLKIIKFSKQDIIDRSTKANNDFENGRYKTQDVLEQESAKW